ncbi:SpoIVB peptidase S55 domain-containing protein [Horticoccus sp. 23ND18S-11]|uniref:SpoIVB peptidase S55 domain-containing protein n=1 Tax=Horticoccus sp. 23ND18S-11 TaxID=3391832 RepID=UPI0039C9C784
MRRFTCFLAGLIACAHAVLAQPVDAPLISLNDLQPGQTGVVWTVFQGTQPEPFSVEVTGVLRNALGPGKSLIICQLTDARVQKMGAVAGMSGSPLYIDGKLAGALSYQVQRFETVRYAGFTPAADLDEVRTKSSSAAGALVSAPLSESALDAPYRSLQPVFTLGGLSPAVADLFAPRFSALGLQATALGGSTQSGTSEAAASLAQPGTAAKYPTLRPGSAVSVALATGDITLAGTGTVSRIDGQRVTAFGHPMLSLGEVALPMCAAEIITILPSQMSSVKIANTGAVIGTITQDRLSAVSGSLGSGPEMTRVEVTVTPAKGSPRTLRFSVARQQQLTPVLVAAGVSQAILGSNDAGLANGFRLRSDVSFPAASRLAFQTLYSGPQGFAQGLNEFIQGLAANLQNPYAKTFPDHVSFSVEPLETNPAVTLDLFQLSRTSASGGQVVQATIAWRDWQGDAHRETIDLPINPAWIGKQLEVILAPGRALDQLTGRPRQIAAAELRSFEAYLAAMRDDRPTDGVCIAVVEKTSLFSDQTVATPEAPGSIERIARGADEARFRRRDALLPLWEQHFLAGKLLSAIVRRPLTVVE